MENITEKKENNMKKGIIYFHQGWTDFINCLSIVRYYDEIYDEIVLPISSKFKSNVDFFIRDAKNIKVIYLSQEVLDSENKGSLSMIEYLKDFIAVEEYDNLFHGFPDHYRRDEYKSVYPSKFNTEHFVKGFYTFYDIDYINRVEKFEFKRDESLEDLFYKDFIEKHGSNYILYNEDTSRNLGKGLNIIKKEGINYVNLTGLADNIFVTIKVLENAKELYLIDSVWASFCYLLDSKYGTFRERNTFIFLFRLMNRPGGCLPHYLVNELEPVSLKNWHIINYY